MKNDTFVGCFIPKELDDFLILHATALEISKSVVIRRSLQRLMTIHIKDNAEKRYKAIICNRIQEKWYKILYKEMPGKKDSEIKQRFDIFKRLLKADYKRKGLAEADVNFIFDKLKIQ